MADEKKEEHHWPWEKTKEPEAKAEKKPEAKKPEAKAAPAGVRTYGKQEPLTAEQQHELKQKADKARAEAKAEAEAKEAAEKAAGPKKTVKIESVSLHPATREVSVHGTVDGDAAGARFTEADLMTMETVEERQRYVARHLKSVVAAGIEPPPPPEHLAILGTVKV